MKLLLDEMLSPKIARQLRRRSHDVASIQEEHLHLQGAPDSDVLEQAAEERRAIVTNNIRDFMPLHRRWLIEGRRHYGIVLSDDKSLPRSHRSIGLWVRTLDHFLSTHLADDALVNGIHFLSPRH